MGKRGIVSLWVGNMESSEAINHLLKTSYTDDGEFIPSLFAQSFGVKRYDDAVREAEFYEEASNSLHGLLEGFSYDDVIIPKFMLLCGEQLNRKCNSVILLFNFEYEGNVKKTLVGSADLEFLGAVKYL